MRAFERTRGLLRSPKLIWDVLVRGRYDFVYDQIPVSVRGMSLAKRWNLFKAGGNLVHRRLNPWSMPLHMQFELTSYCNLRCPVCPVGIKTLKRKPLAMSVEVFERALQQVGPYLLTLSLWGWGEPLLHPHVHQILSIARRYPIFTLLSTNGQNLDNERVIQALVDAPPTHLIVAIDGLTDEVNSQFRVGAKLAPALKGVQRLAEIKQQRGLILPILHLRFIAMKHNQHQLSDVCEFAKQHGFDFLSIRTLSIIDIEAPDRVHKNFVPDAPNLRAYDYQADMRIRRSDFVCQQPFWFPTLFADGTLVACEQDYNAQQPLGSLNNGASFRSVWSSPRAAHVRRRVRDHPETLSFCRNCPFADRATPDCSIQALVLNPKTPNPVVVA